MQLFSSQSKLRFLPAGRLEENQVPSSLQTSLRPKHCRALHLTDRKLETRGNTGPDLNPVSPSLENLHPRHGISSATRANASCWRTEDRGLASRPFLIAKVRTLASRPPHPGHRTAEKAGQRSRCHRCSLATGRGHLAHSRDPPVPGRLGGRNASHPAGVKPLPSS